MILKFSLSVAVIAVTTEQGIVDLFIKFEVLHVIASAVLTRREIIQDRIRKARNCQRKEHRYEHCNSNKGFHGFHFSFIPFFDMKFDVF